MREQIIAYRRRIQLLSVRSESLSCGLIAAAAAIVDVTPAQLFPGRVWVFVAATVFLSSALPFVLPAAVLEIREDRLDRRVAASATGDSEGLNR